MRRVALIVADGLRPDAISPGQMPSLDAMSREFTAASHAATIRPSTTVTALASLATGLSPARHGLTTPGLGFMRRLAGMRPLAREIGRAGLPTQVVTGVMQPLPHAVVASLVSAGGVGRLRCAGTTAREVARATLTEAASQRDGVIVAYLDDCDVAGHRDGWMSPAYLAAAGEVDAAVGALAALAEDSLVIVLADHGGGGVTPTDHHEPHPLNEHIPLVLAGRRRRLNGRVSLLDVPPTMLHWLGVAVPPSYEGRVLAEAFAPAVTAEEFAA